MTEEQARRDAIARNMKAQIRLRGRTQNEIARRVEMSESAWYRRMDGRVPWRHPELRAIARELGMSVDELTGDAS